ncbi:MAG: flavin reductase, partial [Hyphomicrobiales bacterium]|nr:flavin reductase [Hyphomicrobiales bacterium]
MIADVGLLSLLDASPTATLDLADPVAPSVSRAEFGEVMSRMASTVSVVTATFGGEMLGRTATAVLSLSATPPAILVSVDIRAPLADLIIKSGKFSLAMLARDQEMIG